MESAFLAEALLEALDFEQIAGSDLLDVYQGSHFGTLTLIPDNPKLPLHQR